MHAGNEANLQIHRALYNQSLDAIQQSGLPYHLAQQRGGDFGSRLVHAVEQLWKQNYEGVILVGSDCPGLRSADLAQAARLMEDGSSVLGPDRRGGFWLWAINKQDWQQLDIHSLDWGNSRLFEQLQGELEKNRISIARLAEKSDWNKAAEIWEILSECHSDMRALLKKILQQNLHFPQASQTPEFAEVPKALLRGPPAC